MKSSCSVTALQAWRPPARNASKDGEVVSERARMKSAGRQVCVSLSLVEGGSGKQRV